MVEASPRFREWYGSLAPESEKLPLGACLGGMCICVYVMRVRVSSSLDPRPRAPVGQRRVFLFTNPYIAYTTPNIHQPHPNPLTHTSLPTEWAGLDRTPILKMLVVRCLRPDRMTVALTNFIRAVLPNGERRRKGQKAVVQTYIVCI